MAAASLQNGNIRDELRNMFHEVIGDGLRGEVEKFVLFDLYGYTDGEDCAVVFTTTRDVHAISFVEKNSGESGRSELQYPHLRSRMLVDLCGLGVTDVSFASLLRMNIMFAAGNGQLFLWGKNDWAQLGIPQDEVLFCQSPLLIRGPLREQAVVKVACGLGFSVCLTAAGEVWSWGRNTVGQLGNGSTSESCAPCRVQSGLEDHRVVSVSCGCLVTMALTDEGQVFSWGAHNGGKLGRETLLGVPHHTPGQVRFAQDVVIKSIACGIEHTLALTTDGRVYAWGTNLHGELGIDDLLVESSATPLMVNFGLAVSCPSLTCMLPPNATDGTLSEPRGRHCVTEVAAHPRLILSAAKTASGEVYVWGRCRFEAGKRDIASPVLIPCTDLDEAFLNFSTTPTTFRLTSMEPVSSSRSINSCLQSSFNDETTADIKFVAEGKPIYVHKAFLKIRSEHFCRMFAKGATWAETEAVVINVTEYSYPVYHALLFYLYTDTLADGLAPDDLLGLLDLAQSYCENKLRASCVARISETIKCDSACALYMGAIRCAAKDVENLCCDFMVQHLTELASSRALRELSDDLLFAFLEKAAEKKAFRF